MSFQAATPKTWRFALELLPIVLLPVAFLAASLWLRTRLGGPMLSLIGAAVAIFLMGYVNYWAFRHQRLQDEVHKASAGFAAQWAMPIGQAAFVLLLLLPPFGDVATALVMDLAGDPGAAVDRKVVVLAMTFGFCGVVFLQAVGLVVLNVIWWKSKQ